MTYRPGHIKRDPATGDCALRTTFPDDGPLARLAWLVATTTVGARNATTADVEAWDDLYTDEGS